MISVMRSKTTRDTRTVAANGKPNSRSHPTTAGMPERVGSGQVVSAHGHALLPIKAGSVDGKVGLVGVLAQHHFE